MGWRVPAGSFERLTTLSALWQAWRRTARGKRRTDDVARFELDADYHLCRLRDALQAERWRPGPMRCRIIHDPKRRLIAAPTVGDRVVHQALVEELRPHFDRRAIDQSFATASGRGPLRAVLYHLGCMRRFRWRLSLDVRRYFPSVDRERLQTLLLKRVRDARTEALITAILEASAAVYRQQAAIEVFNLADDPLPPGRGLPIGTYVSQWTGDVYLHGLDHFIKRDLKMRGYLRFMDDFTLFGDDRERLEAAGAAATAWLAAERGLAVHCKHGGVQSTRRACTYLGYRVTQAGVRPGPKMKRRMPGRLKAAAAKGPAALERTLAAYRGLWWM